MYRTSTGAIAAAVAMPLADAVALGCVTLGTGFSWAAAAYAALVFVALSAGGLHRLRICLRVADQAGWIALAAAVPVVAVLPWVAAGQALRLAILATGLLIAARVAVSAALRAAHRRGALTEGALLTGDGPAGCELASLLEAHPELGLIPVDVLDSRIGLGAPPAGHSISRVIVCAPGDSGIELDSVLRAARVLADRALAADVCLATRLPGVGAARPGGRLDEVWGVPLVPLRRPALLRQKRLGTENHLLTRNDGGK